MKSPVESTTLIAGVGSPHGGDAAGWRAVELLRARDLSARLLTVGAPVMLVGELEGIERLVVIDACRSGGRPGEVRRLHWPDGLVDGLGVGSTHGLGVVEALRLAETLGRLPPSVELYAIEVGDCMPGGAIEPAVARAAREVAEAILGNWEGVEPCTRGPW